MELLEQTRGLVLADTLDTRRDLADLRRRAPGLADDLDRLRREIDAADHEPGLGADTDQSIARLARYQDLAARRAQLNGQWQALLARIRGLDDNFAEFLKPPPIEELRRHAASGPIVYVTVHGHRGHALIVVDDAHQPVRAIDLPDALTEASAAVQAGVLREAREVATDPRRPEDERHAAQNHVLDVLGWLWDTITEPVLRHPGHDAQPPEAGAWPRIWWCPVGVITNLPLHAAGHHTKPGQTDTVMDRVISSYTPTIRALAGTHQPKSSPHAESMVIIAVPDAPGAPKLDGVTREAHLVHELVPTATVLPTAGSTTARDTVTEELQHHHIAHFACHGIADLANPAASRLLLHDYQTHPLTLHTIARLRLTEAHLAYLSACSTTDASVLYADEAIHITAAFQLAGYRNVIGTLWPINDLTATTIAQDFYTRLTHHATTAPDPTITAQALHHAIRHHRDQYPTFPTRWAAHTHTGA